MFTCEIEGCPIAIFVSDHAELRMRQRSVQKFACYGSIIAIGEDLLDMKHGDEFCIMDKELDIAVVCGLHARGMEVSIEIITVLDSHMFFAKDGTRVFKLEATV